MSDPQTWAAKDAQTKDPYEHAVLNVLAQAGDNEDGANCGISVPTIAARAKMSDREASDCIGELLERRLIGYGDATTVAYIRADRRPVVYDLLIPVSWYSPTQLARVNAWRRDRGRPELVDGQCGPECERTKKTVGPRCGHRPDIVDAPPRKRRSDLGKPRARKLALVDGVTAIPPVHGVTDSPGGLLNADGVTTKSSDPDESSEAAAGAPLSRGEYQSPNLSDLEKLTSLSERERSAAPEDDDPPVSGKNRMLALIAETLVARPAWSRKAIRTAISAEIADGRPEDKVVAAWRACIADPKTTSPARFKHPGHWWDTAYQVPPPLGHLPTSTAKPCTNPDCHHGRVTVVTTGPGGRRKDVAAPCPTCQPAQTA